MAEIDFSFPGGSGPVPPTPDLQEVTDAGSITTNTIEIAALNVTGIKYLVGDNSTYVATDKDCTIIVDLTTGGLRVDLGNISIGHIIFFKIQGASESVMAISRTLKIIATGSVIDNLLEVQMRTINENAIYQRIAPNRIISITPTTRTASGKIIANGFTGATISIPTNIVDRFYTYGVRSYSIVAGNNATAFALQAGYYVYDGLPDIIQLTFLLPPTTPVDIIIFWIATWRPYT